ncbi:hypothetical protein Mmc1_3596 [Magnetococcus marinus MC-1]|uniref:Uncharacterized protein n=1 Tax=Magnetococcus marinus (strain ATCC BAA-1437 / JCM 17883 / MC-1) TaxID=156889 RepID=A0LDN8_MAGMM|nr:type II secretion system protein [Magnetococcus marinus]ABK46081.1 hypothetical protein Mmc1_3596 [Magnetococcus marinus MC-1]
MSGRFVKLQAQHGFTMIELSMVLVVVGLLIAASISLLPGTQQSLELKETKSILKEMKAALVGYAAANGHLPCPDMNATPDGTEDRTGAVCDGAVGFFPYRTLGLGNGVDAWGGHVVYGIHDANAQGDLTDNSVNMCLDTSELVKLSKLDLINDLNSGVRISKMITQDLGANPSINFSCVDADSMAVALILISKGPTDANANGDGATTYTKRFDGNNEDVLADSCFDTPERVWFLPNVDTTTAVPATSYDDVVEVMGFTSLYAKACLTP